MIHHMDLYLSSRPQSIQFIVHTVVWTRMLQIFRNYFGIHGNFRSSIRCVCVLCGKWSPLSRTALSIFYELHVRNLLFLDFLSISFPLTGMTSLTMLLNAMDLFNPKHILDLPGHPPSSLYAVSFTISNIRISSMAMIDVYQPS